MSVILKPYSKNMRTPEVVSVILTFVVTMILLPVLANAQCANWDASGKWSFMQQNATRPVELDMRQNGKAISGSASLIIPGTKAGLLGPGKFGEAKTGRVDGTILGDRFSIEIAWVGGQIGVYNARILPSGRVEGEGFEKSSPNVRHTWNSTGVLKCPPPPPVASTPPRSTGKARSTPPKPPTPPWVLASQVIYPNPLQPMGFVIVSWDAGGDNPNAELSYRLNNSPQIPLVKQAKGGRQMPVERGKYYTYILTDAGKTLATVTVVGN